MPPKSTATSAVPSSASTAIIPNTITTSAITTTSPSSSVTTTTSARKQRCCTICGRPRTGHPRQGCPYSQLGKEPDALNSMSIESALRNRVSINSQKRSIRSRSVEEHKAFLDELHEASKVPPASVWFLPLRDIPRFRRLAEIDGLHTSVVATNSLNPGGTARNGWLVVGGDKRVVQLLKAEMEGPRKGSGSVERKGSGPFLQAVVGGAVAGALAIFVALAFS